MEHKVSVEVAEDDKPEMIASVRKIPLTLGSYIVPVVFDKSARCPTKEGDEGKEQARMPLYLTIGYLARSMINFVSLGS